MWGPRVGSTGAFQSHSRNFSSTDSHGRGFFVLADLGHRAESLVQHYYETLSLVGVREGGNQGGTREIVA